MPHTDLDGIFMIPLRGRSVRTNRIANFEFAVKGIWMVPDPIDISELVNGA